MPSQLEALKKALLESEARSGPDNPFVKGLQAQIAKLEKPPADNPMQTYSAGMRSAPLPKEK
jgi:capsule polysaccharide export protein KpsE/RkpR